jgi:hypothetical protein
MSKPLPLKEGDFLRAIDNAPLIDKGQAYEFVGYHGPAEKQRTQVKQPGSLITVQGTPRSWFRKITDLVEIQKIRDKIKTATCVQGKNDDHCRVHCYKKCRPPAQKGA